MKFAPFRAAAHAAVEAPSPRFRGVLFDATGTLIVPSEPATQVYARHALAHGLTPPPEPEILARFRAFYARPWTHAGVASRFTGDGRDFWRACVRASLAADDTPALAATAEAVYAFFATPAAWRVVPGAVETVTRLKQGCVKIGIVSNFDARLPPLLAGLGFAPHLDVCVTSSETGLEKPNPALFDAALNALSLPPSDVVVVGDDRRNDVAGGRAAGCTAWQLGVDVPSLESVAARVLGEEEV